MIVELGRVLERDGDRAWVQCATRLGCPRCAEGKGCGAGLWSGLSGVGSHSLPARVRIPDIHPGDDVVLGVEERALIQAAVYLYGVPLVSMLSSVLAVHALAAGELWTVVSALAGLAAGFALSRKLTSRAESESRYHPTIVGRTEPRVSAASRWLR